MDLRIPKSKATWPGTSGRPVVIARAYGYNYDSANRLTAANFTQQNPGSSSWTKDLVDFTVGGLSYDAGGNITGMMQKGLVDGKPATVDSLSYQYFANSNQLQKVAEGSSVATPLGDFKDTSYSGNHYSYDANGNTTIDYNRHMQFQFCKCKNNYTNVELFRLCIL